MKHHTQQATRVLLMLLIFGWSSATHAAEIDRRKGLGYAHAIGGPMGLAFNYGLGSFGIETIIGMSRFSFVDDEPEPSVLFAGALGGHFHLLTSAHGALTVGGRFNLATGTASVGLQNLAVTNQTKEVTQFGFDIPLRVYWFPTRHISIHTEFGVAVYTGSEDGLLFEARDGQSSLAPEGLAIIAFRHTSPIGQLGLTYWW